MLRTLEAYHIYIALHNYLKMIRHVRHRLDNLDRIDQYPTSLCHGAICYLRESGARVDEVKSSLKPTLAPLDASLLTTTLLALEKERPEPAADDPIRRTQSCTTSHMLTVRWNNTTGWATPEIRPYENFSLPPTSSVLHYGTECFACTYLTTYAPTHLELHDTSSHLKCIKASGTWLIPK